MCNDLYTVKLNDCEIWKVIFVIIVGILLMCKIQKNVTCHRLCHDGSMVVGEAMWTVITTHLLQLVTMVLFAECFKFRAK